MRSRLVRRHEDVGRGSRNHDQVFEGIVDHVLHLKKEKIKGFGGDSVVDGGVCGGDDCVVKGGREKFEKKMVGKQKVKVVENESTWWLAVVRWQAKKRER